MNNRQNEFEQLVNRAVSDSKFSQMRNAIEKELLIYNFFSAAHEKRQYQKLSTGWNRQKTVAQCQEHLFQVRAQELAQAARSPLIGSFPVGGTRTAE